MGVHWLDLTLNGSRAALDALASTPCATCGPDLWSTRAKHLETLVR